jgi:DNA-binding Lrp family transcriptional regulator
MALSKKREVEELADSLGKSADAAHARILSGLDKGEIKRAQAQSLFQDEVALRVRANGLYLEAVKLTVQGLDLEQEGLLKLVDKATAQIKKIKKIEAFIDLVADLIVLAAAAYAAKPEPIIAAFKEVKQDVEGLMEG